MNPRRSSSQELTSLVGRYGKHLSGSDVESTDGHVLDSLDFDEETREMLGIDDIQKTLDQLNDDVDMAVEEMEPEAESIKQDDVDIKDPDEVIEEMDAQIDAEGEIQGPTTETGDSEDQWETEAENE